jgi:hypothetical protein
VSASYPEEIHLIRRDTDIWFGSLGELNLEKAFRSLEEAFKKHAELVQQDLISRMTRQLDS